LDLNKHGGGKKDRERERERERERDLSKAATFIPNKKFYYKRTLSGVAFSSIPCTSDLGREM
jgi:hypothetical protein